MGLADVLAAECPHVVVATGSSWTCDGRGKAHVRPVPIEDGAPLLTPDDLMRGNIPVGGSRVTVFDNDHYYMAVVLCELLARSGCRVTYVTASAAVAPFLHYTQEQRHSLRRLKELGVEVRVNMFVTSIGRHAMSCLDLLSDRNVDIDGDAVVIVGLRLANDGLYRALMALPEEELRAAGVSSVSRIGDCEVPGTIAAAVWQGHRYAREFDSPPPPSLPYRRERTILRP